MQVGADRQRGWILVYVYVGSVSDVPHSTKPPQAEPRLVCFTDFAYDVFADACYVSSSWRLCLCSRTYVKCLCLLITQKEGDVRWSQRWVFADSIFTHQTELFPVSTRPLSLSLSHRLTLSLRLLLLSVCLPLMSAFWLFPFIVVNFSMICFLSPGCCRLSVLPNVSFSTFLWPLQSLLL